MSGLQVIEVSKSFGGVAALSGVSLTLRPGEIHGLIGPNGSGKTTLLNLLSGYYQPSAGQIKLNGADLSQAAVQRRAVVGIARTFQKPRLLPTLTVLENAVLGGWRDTRSGFVATALALPKVRAENAELQERASELLHGVGLGHALHRRAMLLEHADQRFLEIARALAARPNYLLLDEPAGGLTGAEIERLGAIITTLRDCGLGVLLVEHHTDFVFRLCDNVTALDLGKVIKHGTPSDVRADPNVIRVYLGA